MVSLFASLHVLGFKLQQRLRKEETGATAVEYAILVGVIAVVLIGGALLLAPQITVVFGKVHDALIPAGGA
jgi:pilus assembly protein Flp/PilA